MVHRFVEPGAVPRAARPHGRHDRAVHRGPRVPGRLQRQRDRATPNGKTLILVQSNTGLFFTADPAIGVNEADRPRGETVANGDGILLHGRTLFVVQNQLNASRSSTCRRSRERERDGPWRTTASTCPRPSTASAAGCTRSTRGSPRRPPPTPTTGSPGSPSASGPPRRQHVSGKGVLRRPRTTHVRIGQPGRASPKLSEHVDCGRRSERGTHHRSRRPDEALRRRPRTGRARPGRGVGSRHRTPRTERSGQDDVHRARSRRCCVPMVAGSGSPASTPPPSPSACARSSGSPDSTRRSSRR